MPSVGMGVMGVSCGQRQSSEGLGRSTICLVADLKSRVGGRRGLERCGRAVRRCGLGGQKCSDRLALPSSPAGELEDDWKQLLFFFVLKGFAIILCGWMHYKFCVRRIKIFTSL